MSVSSRTIKTSHADIAISETSGKGPPVLLIHGNSGCKEVFRNQLQSELGETYRMIAMDLPGHGASSDAFEPERTYTMPGYADAASELLDELGIDRFAVLGWSLGGHIGLEMLPRCPGLAGLMIAGTPPVGIGPEAVMAGFKPSPYAALPGKPDLTPEEIEILVRALYGEPVDPAMRRAMVRTDGRARAVMFAGLFAGETSDQRALAERSAVPIAVVNGAEEPLVDLDYVTGLSYGNLWEEHCFVLRCAARRTRRFSRRRRRSTGSLNASSVTWRSGVPGRPERARHPRPRLREAGRRGGGRDPGIRRAPAVARVTAALLQSSGIV